MFVSIIVLGDICPEWGYPDLFASRSAERVFNDILPIFQDADYVIANLEAPITLSAKRLNKSSINLKANPLDAEVIKNAGIKAVALANNHILDYGVSGLIDTKKFLSEQGIVYYGAGNCSEVDKPHIVEINGVKIGFLAFAEQEFNCAVDYGFGAALWDDIDSIITIRNVKAECDYLIVQYHGGIEYYIYPSPLLQKKCRAMADAGADFVTCQHSHCIGTIEKWHASEILYGQGNTIFGYSESADRSWNEGLICKIEIDSEQKSAKISYIPIIATKNGERLANMQQTDEILNKLSKESKNLKDKQFLSEKWKDFCFRQSKDYLPMQFGWNNLLIRVNRLLNGKLIKTFVKSKQKRNAMNLIRCDAHREVVTTILEDEFFRNNPDIAEHREDEI